ncbi:MAG: hypothetical protein U0990_05550 [Candidatus Nanopelagicales bacterium]|nr:hypothetical protein [Candidatus Nanopelagicales bacterium]MDZ4249538.1 hypothetical protein [Candidatus Nanopelagicales bacterium]
MKIRTAVLAGGIVACVAALSGCFGDGASQKPLASVTFTGTSAAFCQAAVSYNTAQTGLAQADEHDPEAERSALQTYLDSVQRMVASLPADAPAAAKNGLASMLRRAEQAARKSPPDLAAGAKSLIDDQPDGVGAYVQSACEGG